MLTLAKYFLVPVLVILLIALGIFLVYRYSTRHDRLAPKRVLQRKVDRQIAELAAEDQLNEKIVDLCKLWQSECPNLADPILIAITTHRSEQAARSSARSNL
jgi:hypothetical protein